MKRALVVIVVALIGCGGFTFQANTGLPANPVTATGTVTLVQLTAILNDDGSLVNVTVVTLVVTGTPQTFTFCGSQNGLFPLNRDMRVSFVPAPTCGNIVAVVRL